MHKAGYIMVWMPQHPRARTHGYVFEHIVVMEDMIGRRLLTDETVHHRNGVRGDNRPENLELWVRSQPSGIRAKDALDWAREIVARYESDLPHPQQRSELNAERSWRWGDSNPRV